MTDYDCRVVGSEVYLLPVTTRMPLKFGVATITSITCVRVRVSVANSQGEVASGWGETPLSVQWAWPAAESYESRYDAMLRFIERVAQSIVDLNMVGHPLEIGQRFLDDELPSLLSRFVESSKIEMPLLAALVCCAAFDIAIHDAYGVLLKRPTYETYRPPFLRSDLAQLFADTHETDLFQGKFPADFLRPYRKNSLSAWHLVGGVDPIAPEDLTATAPNDGYPVLLSDWIKTDGLLCLKIKLRGTDLAWDYDRMRTVGRLARSLGVQRLSADFNCQVTDPEYVVEVLDRLAHEEPAISDMLLYVEQPFPYELDEHPIDVRSVAARKPIFLDESAHDWRLVRRGSELGWNGVALKTCKTQTGALLSLCWAQAHGMQLMVQDLTNPMIAQVSHLLLAAHAETIMGVETNCMQYYPNASMDEAVVHPGLFRRVSGHVDITTIQGPGFGYRIDEIERVFPDPLIQCGLDKTS